MAHEPEREIFRDGSSHSCFTMLLFLEKREDRRMKNKRFVVLIAVLVLLLAGCPQLTKEEFTITVTHTDGGNVSVTDSLAFLSYPDMRGIPGSSLSAFYSKHLFLHEGHMGHRNNLECEGSEWSSEELCDADRKAKIWRIHRTCWS